MDRKQAQAVSKGARTTSKVASWDNFIKSYEVAYDQALKAASCNTYNYDQETNN